MSNIQKQHKISPAIAWLTIQKFIMFYCPLDGEHTISPKESSFLCYFTIFKIYLLFNFMSLHINLQICCSICCSTRFFCSLYREINIILRPLEYDYPPSKDEVFLLPLPHVLLTTAYRKIQFPSLLSVEDL